MLSPDSRLAAVGRYQAVEIWDVVEQSLLYTIRAHQRLVQAMAVSPDGRMLATRSFDDLALWDLQTGEPLGAITAVAGPTSAVAFSTDGRLLASGYDRTSAALWRIADLTIVARFPANGFQHAVAFSPDGGWLATGGQDEVVRVWPVDGGPPITLHGPAAWVDSLAFAPGGRTLAATSAGRVHFWTYGPELIIPAQSPPQPTWSALLAETTGPNSRLTATATEFITQALRLPWFTHIGQPSAWDDTCVRLTDWIDCPEPPDNRDEFVEQQHRWIDAIKIAARTFNRPELTEFFERTRQQVINAVRQHVPYDDSSDSYDPPTRSVWDAADTAATIASFLELGWSIPTDLERRWAWFAAGHWPCEPDRTGGGPPYRLRVL
ncbi:WD40 repeat domain-containing protein [Dactylosporangium matsuzakiense]|uniref:WD40 repeat protein n=1 Tax=Dactylosporangium matsuzakiense TaxID=53360 RepID=A0A9W6KVV3_9ACTN|nr:hypothetical protein [Dactylosporangium matsuzakiense]GLL07536.1 hypothetical protein GCM10017581_092900 [Dactylosporangium matsuzakiense]